MSGKKKATKATIDIGLRIKNIRHKAAKKSVDFSKIIGIAPDRLSDYEAGRSAFAADLMIEIGEKLGVDPGYLLTGRDSSSSTENAEYLDLLGEIIKCHSALTEIGAAVVSGQVSPVEAKAVRATLEILTRARYKPAQADRPGRIATGKRDRSIA